MKALSDIEIFFKDFQFPKELLRLNKCSVIIDQEKFYRASIATLKSNSGNKSYLPYYKDLLQLYNHYKPPKNKNNDRNKS